MIWNLPSGTAAMVDFIGWFVVSLGVSYAFYLAPRKWFSQDDWLTRERVWEQSGRAYTRYLFVMRWKALLPDGSRLSKRGFRKKKLQSASPDYLLAFMAESRRAEWTHFVAFLFTPLFFLWNNATGDLILVLYAALFNLPCVLVQRFNRIRMARVVDRIQKFKPVLVTDDQQKKGTQT